MGVKHNSSSQFSSEKQLFFAIQTTLDGVTTLQQFFSYLFLGETVKNYLPGGDVILKLSPKMPLICNVSIICHPCLIAAYGLLKYHTYR